MKHFSKNVWKCGSCVLLRLSVNYSFDIRSYIRMFINQRAHAYNQEKKRIIKKKAYNQEKT